MYAILWIQMSGLLHLRAGRAAWPLARQAWGQATICQHGLIAELLHVQLHEHPLSPSKLALLPMPQSEEGSGGGLGGARTEGTRISHGGAA